MNEKKGGWMSKVADKFVAPLAVGGAISLAGGFAHLYLSVDHIAKTRFTREMGADLLREINDSSARDAAAMSAIREQLGIVRGQVERLRQELDKVEADFHAHERDRTAHRQ